ncbi:hypothetical protein NUS50_00005, partial [Glaesserella parasuis]|nr:hypothetical protein [Glaesserella parasuis]
LIPRLTLREIRTTPYDLFTPIIFTSAIVLSFALGLLLFDRCQDYLFPLVLKSYFVKKFFTTL